MLLRKINAVISLVITFLLLDHAIFISAWMLSKGTIAKNADFMPWILVGLVAMHAFISIDLAISAHMGIEKRKCKNYPKMNVSTIVQRISGILIAIFTGLHVAGAAGFMHPPQFVHAVVPPLFFAMTLAHTSVSTGKALITLGIGNAKIVKIADVVVKIICGLTLIACVTGFYLYSFKGGAQ